MGGPAPTCPVLKGAFTRNHDSFPCPVFSLEEEPVQMLEPKGRREERPEKNASVSMTLGPSPEDPERLWSLHLYPFKGDVEPSWGVRLPWSEGCLRGGKNLGLVVRD